MNRLRLLASGTFVVVYLAFQVGYPAMAYITAAGHGQARAGSPGSRRRRA